MNNSIITKFMKDKIVIRINDNTKECTISQIDDIGVIVKYEKYDSYDSVYYSLHTIDKIVIVNED